MLWFGLYIYFFFNKWPWDSKYVKVKSLTLKLNYLFKVKHFGRVQLDYIPSIFCTSLKSVSFRNLMLWPAGQYFFFLENAWHWNRKDNLLLESSEKRLNENQTSIKILFSLIENDFNIHNWSIHYKWTNNIKSNKWVLSLIITNNMIC